MLRFVLRLNSSITGETKQIIIYEGKVKKAWSRVNKIVEQWKSKNKDVEITLDCSDNQLTSLPDNLPDLTEINCSDNQLTSLPDNLPSGLTKLWCSYNQLTRLPDNLPSTLIVLHCSRNQLAQLPYNLPLSLTDLWCSNNQITFIPYSIVGCRRLREISLHNNPIDYNTQHPCIMRFIRRHFENIRNIKSSTVYTDSQSVHDTSIQESIRKSIDSIIKTSKPEDRENFGMEEILEDQVLTEKTKRNLVEWCDDRTEHSLFMLTFEELLIDVWGRMRGNEEIKRRLNEEMSDAECKCFTGRIGRLVNCLSGFYDDVQVRIKSADQISSIIVQVRKRLGENYTVEKHRELVKAELEEREYEKDVIEEWISNIE